LVNRVGDAADGPGGEISLRGHSRIVIADDHPLVREALKGVIHMYSELELVGEATDGEEAIELCRRLEPDLVLMDLRMPRMDGIEATRAIKTEFPLIVVLMLTAVEEPNSLLDALRVGAAGYILKGSAPSQIADSIRRAMAGESPLNEEIAMRLIMGMTGEEELTETIQGGSNDNTDHIVAPRPSENLSDSGSSLLGTLTARELEVLRQITRGQTNQQIARSLLISVSTVKNHVRQIMSKLGVYDRTQAAVLAMREGLVTEEGED
jgi:DNA-binding NarL/FixJ family response regulator